MSNYSSLESQLKLHCRNLDQLDIKLCGLIGQGKSFVDELEEAVGKSNSAIQKRLRRMTGDQKIDNYLEPPLLVRKITKGGRPGESKYVYSFAPGMSEKLLYEIMVQRGLNEEEFREEISTDEEDPPNPKPEETTFEDGVKKALKIMADEISTLRREVIDLKQKFENKPSSPKDFDLNEILGEIANGKVS